jgi:hypothetical protein
VGQTLLASNVAAVKFDFTPQGTEDYSWSGYTEIILQGTNVPGPIVPTAPGVSAPRYAGGNLILTGTGGTANAGYVWLTTTNVALPLADWTISTTGVLDGNGAFSNALPVNAAQPARFFKLKMQ